MPKSSRVTINISPTEEELWKEYAKKKDRSLSGFIRYCVNSCILSIQRREAENVRK